MNDSNSCGDIKNHGKSKSKGPNKVYNKFMGHIKKVVGYERVCFIEEDDMLNTTSNCINYLCDDNVNDSEFEDTHEYKGYGIWKIDGRNYDFKIFAICESFDIGSVRIKVHDEIVCY